MANLKDTRKKILGDKELIVKSIGEAPQRIGDPPATLPHLPIEIELVNQTAKSQSANDDENNTINSTNS